MKRCSESVTHEDEQSQKKQKPDTVSYTGFISSCFPSNDISDNERLERAKEEGKMLKETIHSYTIDFEDLAIVNRTNNAKKVIDILISNESKAFQNKKWIALCQTYGIGKTTFCQKFIQAAPEEFWEARTSARAKLIRKAHTIYIDFRKMTLPTKRIYTLAAAVIGLVTREFEKLAIASPENVRKKLIKIAGIVSENDNITFLIELLEKELPDEGFVFLFDELDQINSPDVYPSFVDKNKEGEEYDLERMYRLWRLLAPFIATQNCFPVSCSKSPTVINVGRGGARHDECSPCLMEHVVLEPLSEVHQKTCYLHTKVTLSKTSKIIYTSLAAVLAALGADIDKYIASVSVYSAGVPRVLYLISVALCADKPDLSSDDAIRKFLEEKAIFKQRPLDLIPRIPSLKLFVQLVTFAVHFIPISINASVSYEGKKVLILNAISMCNLHYKLCENSCTDLLVVVPYYSLLLTQQYVSNTPKFEADIRFCRYLVSSRRNLQMSAPGPCLEKLTQVVILHNLQSYQLAVKVTEQQNMTLWGQLFQGIFSKCHFANKPACLSKILVAPMICSRKTKLNERELLKEFKQQPYHRTQTVPNNRQGFQFLQNHIFQENTIIVPAGENDTGFDLLFTFEKSERATKPNIIAAIETKNESSTKLPVLRDKVANVGKLIEDIKENKPHITLIFACLGLQPQIADVIDGDSMLLDSGQWDFYASQETKASLKTVKRSEDADDDVLREPFLYVPENMEVLFLSESGMRKFVTDGVFETLCRAKNNNSLQELASLASFELLMEAVSPVSGNKRRALQQEITIQDEERSLAESWKRQALKYKAKVDEIQKSLENLQAKK
jgi:hypothetical protein